jgi:coproporphyrinogen III oxidase
MSRIDFFICLFGLQSGGRIEAILMLLADRALRYDWKPEPGAPKCGFIPTTSASGTG